MPVPPSRQPLTPALRLTVVVGVASTYALVFFPLYNLAGDVAASMVAIPVIAAGWLFGLPGGLLAGFLAVPLHILLYDIVGTDGLAQVLSEWPAVLTGICVGAVVGWMSGAVCRMRSQAEALIAEGMALKEAQERYQSLVEQSLIGICVIQDGRFVYANPKLAGIFGYTQEALLALSSVSDIVAEEDRSLVMENIRKRISGETPAMHYAFRGKRADGGTVNVEVYGKRIVYNGRPAIMGLGLKITELEETKDALAASEARLRTIIDSEPECVKVVDVDGVVQEMNPAGIQMVEAPDAGAIIGQSVFKLVHPQDLAAYQALHESVCAGKPGTMEFRLIGLQGKVRWMETHAAPLKNKFGDIVSVLSVTHDVTERRRNEEALRTSEIRLQAILDYSPALIFLKDLAGQYLRINEQFKRVFRLTDGQVIGKTDEEIFPPEQAARFRANDRKVLAGGVPMEFEEVAQHEDGQHTSIVHKFPLRDARGVIYALCGIAIDITARIRAEALTKASQRQYQDLVDSLSGIVWEMNVSDYRFTFVSRQCEALLGYSPEQWVSRLTWQDLIHPDDRATVFAVCREAIAEKRDHRLEYRVIASDGRVVWIKDIATVVVENGHAVKVRGVLLDITERKEAEAALQESQEQLRQAQKMEAIGQLAGGIAHDFNNLLTVMQGYASFLSSSLATGSPEHSHVKEIAEAVNRAAGLTQQLLAFSRRQVITPKVLNLNAIVLSMGSMLKRIIGEDITLETALDITLHNVKADPGQIQQLLMNLAVNARDAMPQGGRLLIHTANEEVRQDHRHAARIHPAGSYVRLLIRDGGSGMDAETQARIFEPFFTTKARGRGTGLGLSMVYGIVRQNGGYIFVESRTEEGTTFTIYLPKVGELADSLEPDQVHPRLEGGSETICLVEDEPQVRFLLCKRLRDLGYNTLGCETGSDAVSLVRQTKDPVHLLVTDVILPGMNGREVAEAVRAAHPETAVLFISGYPDEVIGRYGVLDAGTQFLQKPFPPDALARKAREVLDRQSGR